MKNHSEIDETLLRLGSVQPPYGLETRIKLRLEVGSKGFFLSVPQAIGACALAASVAVSAVVFQPALRNLVLHHHTVPLVEAPRVAPGAGGFGTASGFHVPVAPVAVGPTPVNRGCCRSRSGRAVLPAGSETPLPRGVAAPSSPLPPH
jgi:hypothetical protein